MRTRLAPGYDNKLQPVAVWEVSEIFDGAGGLFSTANDLSRFLQAAMGRKQSALNRAFSTLTQLRRPADIPERMAAQGWFVSTRNGNELVWKDGATVGYSSFMGYAPRSGAGLILLTNGMCGNTLTPLGKHLLDAGYAFPESQ
jgi:CubicO group peptidase (beta-lactamase class C family)